MAGSQQFELAEKRVWVAGHTGMVGSAIMRRLGRENCELVTASRQDLDLTRQAEVEAWMEATRPQVIFLAAARVGGILANDRSPADFLYDNLLIEANIIRSAVATNVEKLLFLGSSCIYPKHASQPIGEDALLTGPLEPTNEWYAIAKITGLKLCQAFRRQRGCDFIAAMPTNLYGPGDNFDLQTSHVVPALLRKAYAVKVSGDSMLEIWGTGEARREFLHVDDCADALVHLMKTYSQDTHINVGCGQDLTIRELAQMVMETVGVEGSIVTDPSKPDGTPRKRLDTNRLTALGWTPKIDLASGLAETYRWYLENREGATYP